MSLSSGLAFPFIVLRFPSDLVHVFVANMLGGILGALPGIWIPVRAKVFSDFAMVMDSYHDNGRLDGTDTKKGTAP